MLLKKYKNQLYHFIKNSGYSISDFELKEIIEEDISFYRLEYKDTPMSFAFRQSENSFHDFDVNYTNFDKKFTKSDWVPEHWIDFLNVLDYFNDWIEEELDTYIEETTGEDLWLTMESTSKSLKLDYIDFNDNSPFSSEEKAQIKLGLNEIKILLSNNFKFNNTQNEIIEARLTYLDEAVERNTKSDWKGITISTIIGMVLNLGVDTETGKAIWELFRKVFENLPNLPMPF